MGIFLSLLVKPSVEKQSFEIFPREIAWRIFDYVPESVFDLRLTSSIVRDLVDEYAMQRRTIQLVDDLTIYGPRSSKPPFKVLIMMEVPKVNAKLFELRLRLRKELNRDCHAINGCFSKIERMEDNVLNKRATSYSITLNTHELYETFLRCVGESIGGRIGKMGLLECRENTFDIAAKLLDGVQFKRMEYRTRLLTQEYVDQLLKMIESGKVENAHLTVYTTEQDCDSVQLLRDLSSVVRSTHIHQAYLGAGHSSHFLGRSDFDWSPVILDMFSGTLSKLWIDNQWYPAYITLASADRIRERLPKIGKNVWFKATCNAYASGLNYGVNEHLVQADSSTDFSNSSQPQCSNALTIQHTSRANEQFDE